MIHMEVLLVLVMSSFSQGNSGFPVHFQVPAPMESRFPTLGTATAAEEEHNGDTVPGHENTVATLQSQLTNVLERLDKMEKKDNNRRSSAASRINSLELQQKELKDKLAATAAKSSEDVDAMKSDFNTLQSNLRAVKSEVQAVKSSLQEVSIIKSDDQQTGDAVAKLASTVEGLESKSEKAQEHIRQLADRLSTAEAKASMGSACNDNSDCLVERSLCINDVCVCDPGLAYHPEKNKCVDKCTTYGQHYTALRGYYIGDHNVENYHLMSETQCKDACTAATSFVCRSADLRTRDGFCSLTHESLKTVPKSSYRVESKTSVITHFSRNCLN